MSRPLARTYADILRENTARFPDRTAVIFGGERVTYSQLLAKSEAVANALRGQGIGRFDRVGLIAVNSLNWLEVLFGAGMVGAVVVPLSTWSTRAELEFLLRDSEICFLFSDREIAGRSLAADILGIIDEFEAAATSLPLAKSAVVLFGQGNDVFQSYDNFLRREPVYGGFDGPSAGDDAIIIYTSGSSGKPKAVRLQHFGAIENGYSIGERQGLGPDDRLLLSSPLFWSFGSINALPAIFTHGGTLVLLKQFKPELVLQTVERERCTAIYTLPAMTHAILAHPEFDRSRTKTLRTGLTIGGERDFFAAAEEIGIPELCNIYGATETYGNCVVTWHHWPLGRRARTQGAPLSGVKIRFRDPETGEPVVNGEVGQIEVAGYISPGYTGESAKSNAVFRSDGYYQTGDLGYLNEERDLVFLARNDDMIKRSGINVSPAEIEGVLLRQPGVVQAVVVGADASTVGQRIVAFVILGSSSTPDRQAILDGCRALLSKYKIPDVIEFVDTFPATVTGKVQRRELKNTAESILKTAGLE